MRTLSPEEIKMADALTVEKQGVRSIELMERAAFQFAMHLLGKFGYLENGLIVCGPGNNGGDGLALARILASWSLKVSVFLPDGFSTFSADYQENRKQLPDSVDVFTGNAQALNSICSRFEWIGDALFGVGLNRPLHGDVLDLVSTMNSFEKLKISVDVPSGLMDKMPKDALAFKADWIGTFHSPKLSFMFASNQDYVNDFEVINIDLEVPETRGPALVYLQKDDVKQLLKSRKKFTHKGTYGHALLIAGSYGKLGAAVLSSKATLAVGAGLLTVFVPECGYSVLQTSLPEAMCLTGKGQLKITDLPDLEIYQAIGSGPGLGKDAKTAEAIKELLTRSKFPLVLDADALNILAENKDWLKKIPKNSLLTPHPKEFERLVGKVGSGDEMLEKAKKFTRKYKVILILKGAHTAIVLPDGSVYFNSTGNPGMAKGGSGDLLTGMLTGFLAQHYTPLEASLLGVYIHGLAGDLAAEKYGTESFLASHLIGEIGKAMSLLKE